MTSIGLDLSIDPNAGALSATTKLSLAGEPLGPHVDLFLNGGFTVDSAAIDGVPTPFGWSTDDLSVPYVEMARPLAIDIPSEIKNPRELTLKYHGNVREPVADVNVIQADLVELAVYAAYFPRPLELQPFVFRLKVTMPREFVVVTRGKRTERRVSGDNATEVWETKVPGIDVPIFASSDVRVESERFRNTTVSVYYRELPALLAREALADALATLGYLNQEFGATAADALRVVFSPRGGWGYSRSGLFVVSEQRHRALMSGSFAIDEHRPADAGAHGNAHEISHFWWSIAAHTGRNDWINESIAEFSAAKDSQRRGGRKLLKEWATFYAESVKSAAPDIGIVETPASSQHRYVNWYQRGALFFICAEKLIGSAELNAALRRLLVTGRQRRVTTEDLLDEMVRAGTSEEWLHEWLRDTAIAPLEQCVANL